MSIRPLVRRFAVTLLASTTALTAAPGFAACSAASGAERATLVELYTSEGCSSCPPADRRLGQLTRAGAGIVPLALHVDYWDSIGWKDPFAQPSFTGRQQWEVQANAHRTSYTPHFFVDGNEVLDWRSDLNENLRPSHRPAGARIAVVAEPAGGGRLHVRVDGTAVPATRAGDLRLFVVVTESGLTSQVGAGENSGARLSHDAVARHWIEPVALRAGSAHVDRMIAVPEVAGGHVAIVAFVQDAATAEVLQAVGTDACPAN